MLLFSVSLNDETVHAGGIGEPFLLAIEKPLPVSVVFGRRSFDFSLESLNFRLDAGQLKFYITLRKIQNSVEISEK